MLDLLIQSHLEDIDEMLKSSQDVYSKAVWYNDWYWRVGEELEKLGVLGSGTQAVFEQVWGNAQPSGFPGDYEGGLEIHSLMRTARTALQIIRGGKGAHSGPSVADGRSVEQTGGPPRRAESEEMGDGLSLTPPRITSGDHPRAEYHIHIDHASGLAIGDSAQAVDHRRTIDTGGGAYIEGSADTDGGDFVGGDKTIQRERLRDEELTCLDVRGGPQPSDVARQLESNDVDVEFSPMLRELSQIEHLYKLSVVIRNCGDTRIRELKLELTFPNFDSAAEKWRVHPSPNTISQPLVTVAPKGETVTVTRGEKTVRVTYRSVETLFSRDVLDLTDTIGLSYRINNDVYRNITRMSPLLWRLHTDDRAPKKGTIPIADLCSY
jgi:hypothetical protein